MVPSRLYTLGFAMYVYFSPLRKVVDRAIYFTFRNFIFLTADKLSQDAQDRLSRSLHQMIGMCLNMTDLDLFLIPHGTLPWLPVKSKNRRFFRTNLLCRTTIPKRIAVSQFRFQKIKQNEFLYIVHNFGDRVYAVNNYFA